MGADIRGPLSRIVDLEPPLNVSRDPGVEAAVCASQYVNKPRLGDHLWHGKTRYGIQRVQIRGAITGRPKSFRKTVRKVFMPQILIVPRAMQATSRRRMTPSSNIRGMRFDAFAQFALDLGWGIAKLLLE